MFFLFAPILARANKIYYAGIDSGRGVRGVAWARGNLSGGLWRFVERMEIVGRITRIVGAAGEDPLRARKK